MRYLFFIAVLHFLMQYPVYSQTENYKHPSVGICEFYRESNRLAFPAIELNESERLELRFDIFSVQTERLRYEVTLCDYNWEPVDLSPDEYIETYSEKYIESGSFPINTTYDYVHYRLSLPNEELQFLKPGNYLLSVYGQAEENIPIIVRRFVVFQSEAEVKVGINKAASEYSKSNQELQVEVLPDNPFITHNLKLVLLQNNNWATYREYTGYRVKSGSVLAFDLPGQLVFPGRNEFRYFDIKSLKHKSERIAGIEYKPPYYHVWLKPDEAAGSDPYFYSEDLNGLFYIDNTDTDSEDILDADYVYVHFQLDVNMAFPTEVYIDGALNDWGFGSGAMVFSPECSCYKQQLLLKQGIYNYRYALRDYGQSEVYYDLTEGEHFETGNSYLAILYYQPHGERYFVPAGIGVYPLNQ